MPTDRVPTSRRPFVIPLDDDGLRLEPRRLHIEDGWIHPDVSNPRAWRIEDVTDTGRVSRPEGWPVLRFSAAASDPTLERSPLDAEMIVEVGLDGLRECAAEQVVA